MVIRNVLKTTIFLAFVIPAGASELSQEAQERIVAFTEEEDRGEFAKRLLLHHEVTSAPDRAEKLAGYVLNPASEEAIRWAARQLESEEKDFHLVTVATSVRLQNQFPDNHSSRQSLEKVLSSHGLSYEEFSYFQRRLLTLLLQIPGRDMPVTKVREELRTKYSYGLTDPMKEEDLREIQTHLYEESDLSVQEYWYLAQIYLGQRPEDEDFLKHVWNEGTYLPTGMGIDRSNLMDVLQDNGLEEPIKFVLERLRDVRLREERNLPQEAASPYSASFAFIEATLTMESTREFVREVLTVQPGRYYDDFDKILRILVHDERWGHSLLNDRSLNKLSESTTATSDLLRQLREEQRE